MTATDQALNDAAVAAALENASRAELIARIRALESSLAALAPPSADRPAQRSDFSALDHPWADSGLGLRAPDLYDLAPVGSLFMTAGGRIEYINTAGAALLGWDRQYLRGKPFEHWVAAGDGALFREHLRQVLATDARAIHELRIKDHQGRLLDIRLTGVVVRRVGLSPLIWTIMIDLSELRQAERSARLAQTEVAHLSRLRTLGEFTANLVHELGQPLGSIQLSCAAAQRLVRSAAQGDARVGWVLEQIARTAERASSILQRLREFARRAGDNVGAVEVNALLIDAVGLVDPDARDRGVSMRLELAPGLPEVFADRMRLQEVVINLLQNSIEAMDGSCMALRTIIVRSARSARSVEGGVEVIVQDTGPGLRKDECEHVFESFYTTKQRGLGLGLTLSRSIANAHRGRLWAESPVGGGARFHLTLPAAGAT